MFRPAQSTLDEVTAPFAALLLRATLGVVFTAMSCSRFSCSRCPARLRSSQSTAFAHGLPIRCSSRSSSAASLSWWESTPASLLTIDPRAPRCIHGGLAQWLVFRGTERRMGIQCAADEGIDVTLH